MKKKKKINKNPLIAAILNFLFPGLGFVYLSTPEFVILGSILFFIDLILSIVFITVPLFWLIGFCLSFFWAILGYISAEYVNQRTH